MHLRDSALEPLVIDRLQHHWAADGIGIDMHAPLFEDEDIRLGLDEKGHAEKNKYDDFGHSKRQQTYK